MEPRSVQEVSLGTRFQAWFESIPLYTRGFLVLVVFIYVFQLFTGWPPTGLVCLSVHAVVRSLQVQRLFTAALFHMGILHVAFNMIAFVPIGQDLERLLGTLQFAYLNFVIIALEGLLYTVVTFLLQLWGILSGQCVVGASGLVFGLIVVDNSLTSATHRSILGLFTVPAKWYPWVLLVFWQMLMPDVSFIGHLSGVLVGEAYARGWLEWLKLSSNTITKMEDTWPISTYFVPHPGFIMRSGMPVSHSGVYQTSNQRTGSSGNRSSSLMSFSQLMQWAQNARGGTMTHRGGHADSAGDDVEGGHAGAESASTGPGTFQGPAHHLGGARNVEVSGLNPRAAAAAAAEARLGVGGGTSSRPGSSEGNKTNGGATGK